MKFKLIERYVPASKKQALANVAYHEEELYDVCAGMMTYIWSKDEFMQWVDEVYERAHDDYNDWLSVQ